ncbi:MAG: hypothetical protein ABEN55_13025, partial [Bradymonadaceae bacterium]
TVIGFLSNLTSPVPPIREFGVVSSSTDAPGPGVIKSGGSESFTYRVPSNGILPVVVFLEPARIYRSVREASFGHRLVAAAGVAIFYLGAAATSFLLVETAG